MYDVITVGSATIDVFADSESELIKIKSAKSTEELIAYPSGSKILIKDLQFLTGGGGTNTAVCLSRLGHKVAYLGNLGIDYNTQFILDQLKNDKVDFLGTKDKGKCGFSVILKSLEHDRAILAYKGMNDDLTPDEVDFESLKTKWFYFSSMMKKSFETLKEIAKFAEKNSIKIVFNPSNYLAEKGSDYLKDILTRTEYLILNRDEAELLAGKGEILYLIEKLKGFGPKKVVITDGRHGAHTTQKNYHYHIQPTPIKVFDTTGAGDSFAASFLSGMIKKNDVKYALKLGQANAESVIQHTGAKNILLNLEEAESVISKRKYKVKKVKVT
ncbi:MAG: carbohydrate kinase family protein [Nanoarchaeota archaeon]|nr:carbohydrate kinase family protein [Nanoarchaeota archaeon]